MKNLRDFYKNLYRDKVGDINGLYNPFNVDVEVLDEDVKSCDSPITEKECSEAIQALPNKTIGI
jgi:hypothetical protein